MKRTASPLLAGTIAFAACGSDDASPGAISEASAGTEASSSTAPTPPDTSAATEPPPTESFGPGDAQAADAAFPVTIDHKFGSTTIEAEPTRVVSVGFNEHDVLLALGVVPVGLRDWYRDQPNGVWPWAQDELGGAEPEVLSSNSLTYEQIAALNPDLIVGVWSGMTDEEYELLSKLAPTVAQPEINDSAPAGSFYLQLSPEDISPLDVDVLVWVAGSQEGLDSILTKLPTRASLDAVNEGREAFANIELGGAFSHGSPLRIEFVLDELVPEIKAAASTTAWSTVFDSTVAFADKAPFMADAGALSETVQAYTDAGTGFGGISLVPTDVVVNGESAEITYDANFGENPAYGDQTGTITQVDGVWTVSRDEFCAFMSSARVAC